MSFTSTDVYALRDQIAGTVTTAVQTCFAELSPTSSTALLHQAAMDATAGGKRLRGILALLGARAIDADIEPPLHIAAALELYQSSALAHDDVIDHASTRRGRPTPHVFFDRSHVASGYLGDSESFGQAGAILLGDLLLSMAEMVIAKENPSPGVRAAFSQMHAQVALGQYLDIQAEHLPLNPADSNSITVEAAIDIMTRKSANYSVVYPFIIGALHAGATEQHVTVLRNILTPWGLAFQMRDDDLGIFGDPETTGKPAGTDLVEGKRTALLALTWERANETERRALLEVLGNSAATSEQVSTATNIVGSLGRRAHEDLIADYVERGHLALSAGDVEWSGDAVAILEVIARILTQRKA